MESARIATPMEWDHSQLVQNRRAWKLLQVIGREHGGTAPSAPTIMALRSTITPAEVEAECPGTLPIFACDFYLQGAEAGHAVPGGLRLGRILNVDHHAPLARMEAPVTSTHFAYEHLTAGESGGPAPWVVINHTDCDSVLSSAMLMGYVRPDPELVAASVCADHTGVEHPVADLLQALDEARQGDRTEEQYLESLRNLRLLLAGHELEPVAADALCRRRERRAAARRLVGQGSVRVQGGLAFGRLDEEIDGAFFPALLPDAAVIMLASPHPRAPGHWTVKLRLGLGAPQGLTLHALRINDWDPAFGGRWNAGSNKRDGGTPMDPDSYAARLRDRLAERLASLHPAGASAGWPIV